MLLLECGLEIYECTGRFLCHFEGEYALTKGTSTCVKVDIPVCVRQKRGGLKAILGPKISSTSPPTRKHIRRVL